MTAPFSIPLHGNEAEAFCRARWRMSVSEVCRLERRGAPIRRLPSDSVHGERRFIVVTELDGWLSGPATLAKPEPQASGAEASVVSLPSGRTRSRRLRHLRGDGSR